MRGVTLQRGTERPIWIDGDDPAWTDLPRPGARQFRLARFGLTGFLCETPNFGDTYERRDPKPPELRYDVWSDDDTIRIVDNVAAWGRRGRPFTAVEKRLAGACFVCAALMGAVYYGYAATGSPSFALLGSGGVVVLAALLGALGREAR